MLDLVPFERLGDRHIERIVASLRSAPAEKQIDGIALLHSIQRGYLAVYEWETGLIVLGVDGKRLSLEVLSCDHLLQDVIPLVADLRQIAADRGCDMIETIVFDTRLGTVIQKLGGRVESMTLTLAVESTDG